MRQTTPVTLVTGFLGSGKTTLVNHVLQHQADLQIGIVVNEFGELGIDGSLITQTDGMDIVELANGCVCCASRGDLEAALSALASSDRHFDHILLESSGLADPGPVLERLASPPLSEDLHLHQTITLVDAANFDRNLEHAEAAYNQITHADVLVLNKTDMVDADVVTQISEGLTLLNSSARVMNTVHAALDLTELLDGPSPATLGSPTASPDQGESPHAGHPETWTSVSVPCALVLEEEQLRRWLHGLPETVVRAKGILRLNGDDGVRTVVVHSVSGSVEMEEATQEIAEGRLGAVVIGPNLDKAEIRRELLACVAVPEPSVASIGGAIKPPWAKQPQIG